MALSYLGMGDAYLALGQPANAVALHQASLESSKGDRVATATSHGHLAAAYAARGDNERALVCEKFIIDENIL